MDLRITEEQPSTQALLPTEREVDREDYSGYYKECMDRIGSTDYPQRLGLSEETVKKYMLGYDLQYEAGNEDTGETELWDALIIPTQKNAFTVVNTDPSAPEADRIRRVGHPALYLSRHLKKADEPVFVVEDELAALSVLEAGGEAVGLNGEENCRTLLDLIRKIKPNRALVLALDNDAAAEELEAGLRISDISCYRADLSGDWGNANKFLTSDRSGFVTAVTTARDEADKSFKIMKEAYLRTSVAGYLQAYIDDIANRKGRPFIPTGFTKLDESLGGGLFQGLCVLGAITSLGKTTFTVTNIADQIAQSGNTVLIFSLEMTRDELMAKSISRQTRIYTGQNGLGENYAKAARGISLGSNYAEYGKKDSEVIEAAMKAYGDYAENIYIVDGIGGITINKIRKTVENHIRFTGTRPVVIVDYLQLQAQTYKRGTDKQNVDAAVEDLKKLSRDFSIPVIAISSLNRQNYNAQISTEAFKESGGIEYSSDVLIGLQYKGVGIGNFELDAAQKMDERNIEAVILKNRNGPTDGRIEFTYFKEFNYFEED